MRPLVIVMAAALALLQGASALGQETTPVEPGTKPIVKALRAGRAPRPAPTLSAEASVRRDATESKPVARLVRLERERHAGNVQIAPELSAALTRCMGMKPVTWSANGCGESGVEVGAASSRP
jgi:hypothetical protein